MVGVLLPSGIAIGLALAEEEVALPEPHRGEGVLPVARAAIRAVGSSRAPSSTAGGGGGRFRGRLVELRHRRRRGPQFDAEAPAASEAEPASQIDVDPSESF